MATRIDEEQLNELLYTGVIDAQRYMIEGGDRRMFKNWCKSHGVKPLKEVLNDLPSDLVIAHFEIDLIKRAKRAKTRKKFNHKRK